jgi:uncharacterized protein with PIN domain/sulfur carrier protein ThiS
MTHKTATFRFYDELNDFLPPAQRECAFLYTLRGTPTVKEVIEAIGVPHPEVDVVLVNGNSVEFEHRLDNGDRVSVYPMGETHDLSSVTRLQSAPLHPPRFVLDTHLGKLSKRLRLLGFDTAYRNDYDDAEIIRIGREERRTILTRDRALLKYKNVTRGYWIRAAQPREQLLEVLARFDLFSQMRAFERCTVCNGAIEHVDKDAIQDRLEPLTNAHYDEFVCCKDCGRLYWKGSHYQRMKQDIDKLVQSGRSPEVIW